MYYDESRRLAFKSMAAGISSLAFAPLVGKLQAQTKGQNPVRFVFVPKSSAIYPEDFVLEGTGADAPGTGTSLFDVSLKDKALPDWLQPLEPLKDHLTMIQDLSGRVVLSGHGGGYSCLNLTGANGGEPKSISIDCLLGQHLPSVYGTLGFSTCGHRFHMKHEIINGHSGLGHSGSALARGLPLPLYLNPSKCLDSLFGSVASNDAKQNFAETSNIMDFVARDVRDFSRNLSGSDKDMLDVYTHTLESVRARRDKVAAMEATLKKWAPEKVPVYQGDTATDRITAHMDTIAASLITGLTNVATYHIDNLATQYPELGLGGVHGIGHGQTSDQGVEWVKGRRLVVKAHLQAVARLAARLKDIPEGDGSMLDNTLIIYMTNNGNAHHGSSVQMPMLLVGGRNIVRNQGRYLQYPSFGERGHFTLRNFYLTLLHAIGKPRKEFGYPDAKLKADAPHIDQSAPLHHLLV